MSVVQTLIGNIKGPKGDTGSTGSTGAQGPAATITVGTTSTTAYGNAAQVTNSGTSSAAVFDFVIPQGRPGEKTTKMGELTLDTITTSTASFPSPAVDDTGATAFGKIVKFFSDTVTALTGKLDTANVANNLTTTASGYALDARQGKALNDSLENKPGITRNTESTVSWAATGCDSAIATALTNVESNIGAYSNGVYDVQAGNIHVGVILFKFSASYYGGLVVTYAKDIPTYRWSYNNGTRNIYKLTRS